MSKKRADVLVVEQGLADTRSRAQALILAGAVCIDGAGKVDKPGQLLADEAQLYLRGQPLPYVSRGGLKLARALAEFHVDPTQRVCLDIGASTGGFTDCLLQHHARKVYAVDVGYGQLAWKLRQDPRVVVLERQNIRTLPQEAIPEPCSLIVVDVSFISLRLVVPAALRFADDPCELVALVKPQFEVGRQAVGKGGIVRDPEVRAQALEEVIAALAEMGFGDIQSTDSPIAGAKGNREFLVKAFWRARSSWH